MTQTHKHVVASYVVRRQATAPSKYNYNDDDAAAELTGRDSVGTALIPSQ